MNTADRTRTAATQRPATPRPFTMGIVNADALAMRTLREIIADMVAEAHVLWTESSGREAVEHCLRDHRKPDLVLIDLLLQGLKGADTCLLIRRKSARIKLLATQTFPMGDSRSIAIRAGAQGLVCKDDDGVIVGALRTVASGGVMPGFPTAEEAHHRAVERLGMADGRLTVKEMEILDLMVDDVASAGICASLGITPGTLRRHLQSIRGKLHAGNNVQAVLTWLKGE